MKTIERTTNNWTRRDSFNTAICGSLQDVKGEATVKACAIGTDISVETGETVSTGTISTIEHGYLSCISKTAIQQIESLIDIINDEGDVRVKIDKRPNRAGNREFITIELV